MNDPCAPGYDPATGLYHLAFQWNPKSAAWADISWGHCVSRDTVHWSTGDSEKWKEMRPILTPSHTYDRKGIFTGCFVPEGLKGQQGILTVVYTSVSHSPIHYRLPYVRGNGAPQQLNVRAWRDPFVDTWPALSRSVGRNEGTKWGIISGSVEGEGPNVFLYEIGDRDLTKWTFVASLVKFPCGLPASSAWTGDIGKNWEVCNFLSHLSSSGHRDRVWLTMSAEGTQRWGLQTGGILAKDELVRTPRWSLWMAGRVEADVRGQPKVQHEYGGVLDHGCFYASNSFWDPVRERTIAWGKFVLPYQWKFRFDETAGWILEDDLPPALRDAQAWAGVISLPRELFVLRIPNIVGTLRTSIQEIGSFSAQENGTRGWEVETLGIRPIQEVESLRKMAKEMRVGQVRLGKGRNMVSLGLVEKTWEFQGDVGVWGKVAKVGLYMRHSEGRRSARC
ncbi:Arabinanase/levansucrase/invertase [Dacryopinax primogenitus]|uniref:Arabinanase/levansucrase/invertase n=1 Tax=Dacryopinax primogenitus (strain DJM 731) TaxID=1858805 RepID=M5GE85_DACPD|nr:Arabinanase/levansucrase/invertase [Dacryopinax primogenitus]EJU05167.1 Arabinanase/levansucrase/invertase [Dacryopinax primogenitus]